jgi:hypothetical protein
LGLARQVSRLLVHDWAPSEADGDKILYIFDCGQLGDDENRIGLDGEEIDGVQWVAIGEVDKFMIPRLARRIGNAYLAFQAGTTLYLEHGEPRT